MIETISNWAQGIVVAIIIATIIEMILPEGNSKKYVKTVIGVYILYVIVSPIVTNVLGKDLDLNKLLDYEKYMNTLETKTVASDKIEINYNENIKNIYLTTLKEDITLKLKEKGYLVINLNLDVNLNDDNYGKINNINIKLKKVHKGEDSQEGIIYSNINQIEKVNIKIGEINTSMVEEETIKENNNNNLKSSEINKLKEYLNETYGIEKEKININ